MNPNQILPAINFQPNARMLNIFHIVIILTLLSNITYSQQVKVTNTIDKKGFRAAVVKIDITPDTPQRLHGYQERVSTGVHDHIYHKIVVLDDGTTQFFLVSTDACILSSAQYDRISELLARRYRIKPENFWWSFTHTHSAPETAYQGIGEIFMPERFKMQLDTAYTHVFEQKLIEGIIEAQSKLQPARLGAGWGFSQANINRRAINIDGKAYLGMNPDGAVDRRIGLLKIDKEDGTPLVCIANYPMHGTVLGPKNLKISGDVQGAMSEYFEQKIGVPLLFINGAEGNLAPLYSGYEGGFTVFGFFKVILGDKIINAYQKTTVTTDQVKLNTGSIVIETPRKSGLGWPSDMGKYTRTTKTGLNLVRLPIGFLKINEDIMIWSSPAELFCEIANGIRDHSPFPFTFYYGLTNGIYAYMPTEAEWKLKGYETDVSLFTPSAERDLTEAVINYLLEHK